MAKASAVEVPHISGEGWRLEQTSGRLGLPKSMQRSLASSWIQRTPAGLPCGMPGMGEEIDGAIQQAAHPVRHSMVIGYSGSRWNS